MRTTCESHRADPRTPAPADTAAEPAPVATPSVGTGRAARTHPLAGARRAVGGTPPLAGPAPADRAGRLRRRPQPARRVAAPPPRRRRAAGHHRPAPAGGGGRRRRPVGEP